MPILTLEKLPNSKKDHTVHHTELMYDPTPIIKAAKAAFTLIPKEFHPKVHYSHNLSGGSTGSPDYMLSNDTLYLGNATTHPKEPLIGYSIGSHLKMAHMLNKKLKEHKMEKPNVGPYHDHVYENMGNLGEYKKNLGNFLVLSAPKLMHDYLNTLDLDALPPKDNMVNEYLQYLYGQRLYHPEVLLDYAHQLNRGHKL